MATLTAIDILNTIRDNADDSYIARVPEATRNNIAEVGKAITADTITMNTYINGLINKIALSNIVNKMFKNPLARLKSSSVPYGNNIEEIFINPSTDMGFQTDGTYLLKTTKPDGKVCYYGLNRQSEYPASLSKAEIIRGFRSEQEYMSLYNKVMISMYSGDNIDEFSLMKKMLGMAIDNGAMNVIATDISNPKTLMKTISATSLNFTFPSTVYAGYNNVNKLTNETAEKPCITYCDTDRQCLLIRADVQTEINYEVLATMFHMEVAELEAITILVDTIPSENFDVYAVLCDIDAIQVRDAEFTMESQYIPSNLSWNFWLHHWEYLFLSMFGNAVAFGKEIVVTP